MNLSITEEQNLTREQLLELYLEALDKIEYLEEQLDSCGESDSYLDGYDDGLTEGREIGYEEGYEAGWEAAEERHENDL